MTWRSPPLSLFVCNTDPSTLPGKHWIAIYTDHQRRGEYFDPFGLHPSVRHFEAFVNNNCSSWLCNTKTIQDLLSDACGYHCVLYAVRRCAGFDLRSIINMYTANTQFNDAIAKAFVRNLVS
jgi:hypothetical protein